MSDLPSDELRDLPAQPPGLAWPSEEWPLAPEDLGPQAEQLVTEAFGGDPSLGETRALLVVRGGRLVFERYGGALEHLDRPPEPVTVETPMLSWSMAKSVLHAAVGLLVGDGRLSTSQPAPVPGWQDPGDPRRAITVEDLLEMRDGLDFAEDYEDAGRSDVIEMLFGSGRDDVASFAADRALLAGPGERFSYSSGTANVLSGVVAHTLGPGEPYRRYLAERLFDVLGMRSADPGFDAAGTWVASSTLYATGRDFARFGLLYLRDGVWEGHRLLPPGWVDHGRRPRSVDPEDGAVHGAHWWVEDDGLGTFRAAGYEGQAIVVCPGADLVLVRLGKTPLEHEEAFAEWRKRMTRALAHATT